MSKKSKAQLLELKRQELEALEEKNRLREGLPHLHGWKWYPWARAFFESHHKEAFLCAANQISKSSTMIRKVIHWATYPKLWPKLWPSLQPNQVPNQFWYMYPSLEVATIEFETKWEPLFLPKNEYKDHPVYGWSAEFEKKMIKSITFKSGVTIYFKVYSQKPQDLQTATVYVIAADEEMPVNLIGEINARLNATDGYFMMVFTATLGQLHWEQTIQPSRPEEERHLKAYKDQVSLFDCMFYEDGTPSHWTEDKINRTIQKCPNDAEIQRRIYGKFVKSEGLKIQGFSRERNVCEAHPLPKHWLIYSGVDIGSGGTSGHPAAICFVAVAPDFKSGRVFRSWRGDKIATTPGDILNVYIKLREKLRVTIQSYDYHSKDFYLVATRNGEPFTKANKERDAGYGLLDTLFKNSMLKIQGSDSENEKLISEICSLTTDKDKRQAVDDLVDALRYTVMAIPWDFSGVEYQIEGEVMKDLPPVVEASASEQRREWFVGKQDKDLDEIAEEFDFWNDFAGS